MRRILVVLLVIVLLVASSLTVASAAKPDKAGRPENLEQIIFVHPVGTDQPAKPDKPGKPPKTEEPPPPVDNNYYQLWGGYLTGTIDYYVNPNIRLANGGDPVAEVNAAAEIWDAVTGDELFNYAGATTENWYQLDGQNTVSWVKFFPRETLAVAVMYYDPETLVIWEVDIVFNAFHRWGIDPVKEDGDKLKAYDIANIAVHEFGHPVGLDDLDNDLYRELTMYGYSKKGETEKYSLEAGDIAGAQSLYPLP